ncbi:hypothetical protein LWI29_031995 [Acer saccharum]|uniref:peroxidase n=1 Tax=Acer saccharum TaxID=4024 RepID=A0AA39S568_ACESA|nr:hypothetical protein LWI29_029740 [Acer saccharum]KAK0585663.1 hypothetical protein LWI29_031995 [Acer saccharum]
MASRGAFQLNVILVLALAATALSTLSPYYYEHVCPEALPTIKRVVEAAVYNERRMGASLLRFHFHNCFVNLALPMVASAITKVKVRSPPLISEEAHAFTKVNKGGELLHNKRPAEDAQPPSLQNRAPW